MDEGEFHKKIIDNVRDHIAVVDSDGEIVFVNKAWREFGDKNGLEMDEYGVGSNYIKISREADEEEHPEGGEVARQIKAVLMEEKQNAELEYDCHGPNKKRWFKCEITPLEHKDRYAVIKHINVTERRKAENWIEFMRSTMNHDLKNKIQVIEGYNQLIRENISETQKTTDRYTEKIGKSINDTKKLLNKIQAINQVKKEETKPIKIKETIKPAINEYEEAVESKDIEIKLDAGECKVHAGPLLKELFKNLITNSLHHADCSQIKIKTESRDGRCVVSYSDDGVGIPDEKKQSVFKKGYTDSGGSGLGLYLVKKIVERYEGELELTDSREGGAEFKITLKTV